MTTNSVRERIEERHENAVQPEEFLLDVGAVRSVDREEELEFTDEFASKVERYIGKFRHEGVDESIIARIFGVDEEYVEIPDRPYTAYKVIHTVWNWPSPDALVLDAATDAAFRDTTDRWDDVPPRQRYRILQSLRSFQDECFFCGGEIVFDNESVQSCCSPRQVLSLHCADCAKRFLEFSTEQKEAGVNMKIQSGYSS